MYHNAEPSMRAPITFGNKHKLQKNLQLLESLYLSDGDNNQNLNEDSKSMVTK